MYNKIVGIYPLGDDKALINASKSLAEIGYVASMRQIRGDMVVVDFVIPSREFNDLEEITMGGI